MTIEIDEKFKKLLLYTNDPVAFMRDIIGLTIKPFHEEWIKNIEEHKHYCLLAPRGHGKSWLVGSYIIWRVIRDPDVRVLIVTINQDRGSEMMHFIQHHLLANEKLIKIFGRQRRSESWSMDKIRVVREGTPASMNPDPTVKVVGVDSRMIGGHYELIIMDDVTDQISSRTEHRRQSLVTWYSNTLSPMLEPGGKVINIGTSWHPGDIHRFLIDKAGYDHKIYKSILYEKEPLSQKEIDKLVNEKGKSKFNSNARVLWKDRWPYWELMKKKREIGTNNFAMQYQNEFLAAEDAPIRYEWIRYYDKFPSHMKRYVGVDLASESLSGDYFVIVVIGIDDIGDVYVIDMVRRQTSMFKQYELISQIDKTHHPIKIGVESVGPQKMVVDQLIQEYAPLPIIPIKSSVASTKDDRVMRLSVLFESGRIYINHRLTELVDELTTYPKGEFDDCVDALSFAIQAAEGARPINWDEALNVIRTRSWSVHKV